MKIFIDPGHGTIKKRFMHYKNESRIADVLDIGTAGYQEKYNEAENNLAISKELGVFLQKHGHDIVYSRTTKNGGLSLSGRAELAHTNKCELAISLHCDAAENTKAYEMRTYYRAAFGKKSDDYILAAAIAANAPPMLKKIPAVVVGCMPMMDALPRGVAPRAYQVLRNYGDTIPAVLVECGFITQPDVAAYLASPEGRTETAHAIGTAIQAWYRDKTAIAKHVLTV